MNYHETYTVLNKDHAQWPDPSRSFCLQKGGDSGNDTGGSQSTSGKYTIQNNAAVNFTSGEAGATLTSANALSITIKADNSAALTLAVQSFSNAGTFTFGTGVWANFGHTTSGSFSSTVTGSSGTLTVSSATRSRVISLSSLLMLPAKVTVENGAFDCPLVRL
ncbi:hypothetical protein [Paraflavitalea speifideaquila]|uniref:hypothetical protein n=1 Tax=Paraflavitalea speifideaquila TaxID=3076558 RepID=UPI0028EE0241|nr:hypothetical protein [Paraflavitalea speifideiaquila]